MWDVLLTGPHELDLRTPDHTTIRQNNPGPKLNIFTYQTTFSMTILPGNTIEILLYPRKLSTLNETGERLERRNLGSAGEIIGLL